MNENVLPIDSSLTDALSQGTTWPKASVYYSPPSFATCVSKLFVVNILSDVPWNMKDNA